MLNQNVDALLVLLGAICLLIHAIQLELLSIFILEILSILTGTNFFWNVIVLVYVISFKLHFHNKFIMASTFLKDLNLHLL